MIRSSISTALCIALLCCLMMVEQVSVQDAKESRHSRVGDPRYWTGDCFKTCYLVYLRCIGKIFPPKMYNSQEMVELFKNKDNGKHELVEECSAKYQGIIKIENDEKRSEEMSKLNATVGLMSNFDLCVFSQCGAGGYYGSFNINHMKYSVGIAIANKKLDPIFDFYFEMNSV